MLDIKFIRENTDAVRKALADRNDSAPLEDILALDEERRRKVGALDELRQERKLVSKDREKAQVRGREIRAEIQAIEEELRDIDTRLNDHLLRLPNIPHASVTVGKDETENVVVRSWGDVPEFDFTPQPHWDLAEKLGIIDFDRGVKITGTRAYVLRGLGARLQRALIAFMLDLHTSEHGYTEIYPPFMVKREVMEGSGQLPKFADNLYHDVEDDLWFVPTAEVPVTNLHRDEILNPGTLPLHYVAYTPCFRREKMSAGKDTRGIKRGHQFDKVEMYKFCEPENSYAELDSLLDNAEEVARRLNIPYRIVELCTGDLGFGATRSFDVEMWAPGCNEWLEVSSCSNCEDFQARRANIRYRPAPDSKPQYVHTLNGSGLALPRVMIAIMENYQQPDGTIKVPEVLQAFVGTDVIS